MIIWPVPRHRLHLHNSRPDAFIAPRLLIELMIQRSCRLQNIQMFSQRFLLDFLPGDKVFIVITEPEYFRAFPVNPDDLVRIKPNVLIRRE